ncbi:DUF6880 family protein [Mycobacterium riyadhense]|uniref:Gll2284 protein n=2 Tax=Mycobacterium riyadhense TaxID=486698 RepID=A0A653F3W1_9MYCO|nr:DUF6880 family protein [Mycobacterium riyadhense]MCV7144653.1 hypothetical protein [Mycobacterium riyadhense]VTP03682.1 hypothetical protein BIN_B_05208 [Mycobacterium riyadhense]
MSGLGDRVLPLIRTRADVHRWAPANDHGHQMHVALDILEAALPTADPAEAYSVTHKALGSAIKVIAVADDSSGIIGDACRRLLDLHPKLAAAANVAAAKLIDWMMTFQFDGDVDYFTLDPVAYAPALGEAGMITYRRQLMQIEADLGQRPSQADRRASRHSHEWFTIEWNARRLAVLDRDIDAIIATHARDRRVAAWLQETAEAFEEIGQTDLAIDWAKQATDFDDGHQSRRAADYWCSLLDQHRPHEALHARVRVFRRWPSATTAAHLRAAAGASWPDYRAEVTTTLAAHPRHAVMFALHTLKDVEFAWDLAHSMALADDPTWSELVKAYERIDPLAVLPVLQRLVEGELVVARPQNYRLAARRLAKMRRLAAGSDHAQAVDTVVAQLRETHSRRPRLQQEFNRAGLP